MPPFRQRFPLTDAATQTPAVGEDVSHLMGGDGSPDVGEDVSHLMDARKPAAAEDFLPAQPEGSAVGRFLSNAGELLNPLTIAKGVGSAIAHPIDTAEQIISSQVGQGKEALNLARQGRYSEAAGHGLAAVLPVIGPAAAAAGEQIGSGDVAGGFGKAAGLIAPIVAGDVVPAGARGARSVGQSITAKATPILGKAGPILAEAARTGGTELAAHYLGGLPFGSGTAARIILRSALDSAKKAAPAVVNTGGRLVAGEASTLEEVLTDALAEARKPTPPTRITTPPQPELPPGYQPRTTVPTAKSAMSSAVAEKIPAPVRPYFLKSAQTLADEAAAVREIPSRVPFEVADPETLERLPREADLSKPTLERVPLKDLVATQEGLSPDVVRRHLEQPAADLSKVPAGAVGRFDPDAVTVIRGADGRNYLSGGTHRATAAFLRGDPDIQAIVYPSKTSAIPAAVAEKVPAAVRPYFLKSQAQMADEAAAQISPRSTPTESLDVSDLPASWRTHTGQDLFPLQKSVETDAVKEFQQELQNQGMSVSEAIASVSKNKDIPVQLRSRLLSVLMKTRPN